MKRIMQIIAILYIPALLILKLAIMFAQEWGYVIDEYNFFPAQGSPVDGIITIYRILLFPFIIINSFVHGKLLTSFLAYGLLILLGLGLVIALFSKDKKSK